MYHASFIVSLIVFSLTARVSCWGDVGHRTIAYLAQKYLTDSAATFLDGILANDNGDDISDAATWPDRVRRLRPYTAPWHFIGMEHPISATISIINIFAYRCERHAAGHLRTRLS